VLIGMQIRRHSVVEVFTSRAANVDHHRVIQEAVRTAVMRALRAVTPTGVRPSAQQRLDVLSSRLYIEIGL
jgi:hypothetical protein